jgi:DNA-binding beta-propeller fold protein YncE/cytochrome c553
LNRLFAPHRLGNHGTLPPFSKGGFIRGLLCLCAFGLFSGSALAAPEVSALFVQHCAQCHGPDRLGGTGPALLPENLERLKRYDAARTITLGRVATQMPAFGDKLSGQEVQALVDYIYTPPATEPVWSEKEIRASRVEYFKPGSLPAKPVFSADPLNLFVVVEGGDHHATILDGDRLEPITRFPTRFALHGGPKFSHDGRYVYFCSRDGWVSKYDIWNLKMVAEVRAGINARNLAVSSDGKYVLVGNFLPHTLVLLDATDLSLLRVIPVIGSNGKSSRVSAVYDAPPRKSFIAALKDIPEVWEISYDPNAAPVFKGFVHDWKMAEGLASPGQFTPRVIELDDILDDFFFSQDYADLIGASRDGKGQVVNLDVRRKIATLDLSGMPHLASGITWEWQGRPVLATPNLQSNTVSVIDMKDWKTVKHIQTLGPGFFLRSHENTPYAWVDNMMSRQHYDTLQIIDKNTLEIVRNVTPEPGRHVAHVEFTRDGRYALVSLMEMDGALLVLDARTFRVVKRIPMSKPIGKYNVYNKTTLSAGTSH